MNCHSLANVNEREGPGAVGVGGWGDGSKVMGGVTGVLCRATLLPRDRATHQVFTSNLAAGTNTMQMVACGAHSLQLPPSMDSPNVNCKTWAEALTRRKRDEAGSLVLSETTSPHPNFCNCRLP